MRIHEFSSTELFYKFNSRHVIEIQVFKDEIRETIISVSIKS